MELEVNERGNLFVPSSRLMPMLQSCAISAAIFYVSTWLNGIDLLEEFPSPAIAIGFLALCVVVAYLLLSIQSDLEFDNSRQAVVKGRRIVTTYQQIRQVEIRTGTGDEPRYTIALRLGVSRIHFVLGTEDETSASLDAASIARAVNRPVVMD